MKSHLLAILLLTAAAFAQQATTAEQAPNRDTSFIDVEGTAHITRVVPVPPDLSAEAKKSLSRQVPDSNQPESLDDRRKHTDTWQAHAGEVAKGIYPVNLATQTMAGVAVRVITPLAIPPENRDRVLINLHGGGFNSDSGSLSESIPIANLAQMKVISVLYRLAPEHPFPAGLEDAVAVYKVLLKTYRPEHIGIYGTSAGAILTAEMAVKLKQLGLPLPGTLGIFSGLGDFSREGRFHRDVRAGRTVGAPGSAKGAAAERLPGFDGRARSGGVAVVCRSTRDAADTVCHEWARLAAKRDNDPP